MVHNGWRAAPEQQAVETRRPEALAQLRPSISQGGGGGAGEGSEVHRREGKVRCEFWSWPTEATTPPAKTNVTLTCMLMSGLRLMRPWRYHSPSAACAVLMLAVSAVPAAPAALPPGACTRPRCSCCPCRCCLDARNRPAPAQRRNNDLVYQCLQAEACWFSVLEAGSPGALAQRSLPAWPKTKGRHLGALKEARRSSVVCC